MYEQRNILVLLTFLKLGINVLEDLHNLCRDLYAMQCVDNLALVYGESVVYHSQMSLPATLCTVTRILFNFQDISIDPFTNQAMDFYSFVCFHDMLQRIKQQMLNSLVAEYSK